MIRTSSHVHFFYKSLLQLKWQFWRAILVLIIQCIKSPYFSYHTSVSGRCHGGWILILCDLGQNFFMLSCISRFILFLLNNKMQKSKLPRTGLKSRRKRGGMARREEGFFVYLAYWRLLYFLQSVYWNSKI